MRCDIKIMGCVKRMDNIKRLIEKLGLSFRDAAIDLYMRGNPLAVSMDAFRLPHEDGVTHRLVIQDDIEVCDNLAQFAEFLVGFNPDAVFSLYCQTKKLSQHEDGTIIRTGGAIHGPGIIMPLKYVEDIYEKWRKRFPSYIHDDRLYSRYFNQHKVPVYTTVPNVVRLLDGPSYMKHSGMFHQMKSFLGDPLQMKWAEKPGSLGKPAEPNDIILT